MADRAGEGKPVIRWARADDLEAIIATALRAWEPIFRERGETLGEDLMRRDRGGGNWREKKAQEIRNHCESLPDSVLVTELDGRVVGFLTFHANRESGILSIGNNAVDPDYQGRGLGTAQYEYVLAWAREGGLLYAKVLTGLDDCHAAARAAYERAGFDMAIPHVTYYKKL